MRHTALRYYYYSGSRYSTEYQAVLDRATALGYTQPSTAQKTKQNTLIQSLKDAGIWDLLDVFYVFATDGSSDYATLNWKTPDRFQITKPVSPTFTSNQGFGGNGTTQYLNTNWTPSTNGSNYTLNAASFLIRFNNNVASNTASVGALSDGSTRYIILNPRSGSGSLDMGINSGAGVATILASGVSDSTGLHLCNRISSANINCFKNGVKQGVNTALASTALPSIPVYLLARNNNGTADAFAARQVSVFGAGANLESKQSDLYTAWNTYFTSL